MRRYILFRLLQSVLALLVIATIVFLLARLTGNPVDLLVPEYATPDLIAQVTAEFGLDKPLYQQYTTFIGGLVKGDLGKSLKQRLPVRDLVFNRLSNSLKLAVVTLIVVLLGAFPLGIVAAYKRGSAYDTFARVIAVIGQSVPSFWLGIILIEIFAVRLGILPSSQMGGPSHYILPAITLAPIVLAGVMRLLRSSMIEVLDTEYVKLARIEGISEQVIIWKHALRNALIPVVTFAGLYFAILVSMSMVVEVVFAWPGVGRLAYEAILHRDFPVIQGTVILGGGLVILVNLAIDILYAYIDPRIRY